ncbi:MAG TPA: NADPH:quinone reductase [Alphaproteobacteria bacterium]
MHASWFEDYGPAAEVLKVGERETPEPGAGEVRVHVKASGVNPSDVKKRAGQQPALDDGWVIPHSDGAGVIDAVGRGVPSARIGERVWVYQAQYQRRFGTAAQYVCLPSSRAVRLPDRASFEVGACMGIPAMTAHRCVLADGTVAGQAVLVTGGAGRVGHYAIQWAKWAGARVVATAGSEASAGHALAAGADAVVNYRTGDVAAAVLEATDGARIDRVIDVEFGANLETTLKLITTGGVIATYASLREPEPRLPFYRMMRADIMLRCVLVYAMPEQAKRLAAADITRFLDEGRLLHRVAETYALADIANAHEAVESGKVQGCVVVQLP